MTHKVKEMRMRSYFVNNSNNGLVNDSMTQLLLKPWSVVWSGKYLVVQQRQEYSIRNSNVDKKKDSEIH